MKKRWIRFVSGLAVLGCIMTGCGNTKVGGNKTKGKYVEQKIEVPDCWIRGMSQDKDGNIHMAITEGEELVIKVLTLGEDYTWKEEKKIEQLSQNELNMIMGVDIDDVGLNCICCNDKNEIVVKEISYSGEIKEIPLILDGNKYEMAVDSYYSLEKANNGDYIIQDQWGGPVRSFDGKTGEMKNVFSQGGLSYYVLDNTVVINSTWDSAIVGIYDIETGNQIGSVGYEPQSNSNVIVDDNKAVYLFNSKGIQSIKKETTTWENVVEPDNNYFSQGTMQIEKAFMLPDESLLMWAWGSQEMELLRYYYDPEARNTYDNEITIFMTYDMDPIKKAASIYGRQHPETKINIQRVDQDMSFGEYIDGLNTELLSGGGPDMLILDGLPIETYIEKGILIDINDIGQQYIDEKQGYVDIVNTYKQNDKLYAIPLRFTVPMLWGKSEVLKEGASLEKLAAYKKAHPDEVVFNKDMFGLANQLYSFIEPALLNEKGEYDRDKVASYIKLLEEIGEKTQPEAEYETVVCEPPKYGEMLDVADGKADVYLLAPRNVGDIGYADAVLDARGEGTVAPLEINGKVVYEPKVIMGINANSKQQEIVKEIIKIALSDEVQQDVCYLGVPTSEHGVALQETFLDYMDTELADGSGRKIIVDNKATKTYELCKEAWKKASVCCLQKTSATWIATDICAKYFKENKDMESLLDEYDEQLAVRNK